jgi:hypothetical protein
MGIKEWWDEMFNIHQTFFPANGFSKETIGGC